MRQSRRGEIGGVAVVGMQREEARLVGARRPRAGRAWRGRPSIVVARPRGHAMNVGYELRLRLRRKFAKNPKRSVFRPRYKRRAASARAKYRASARDRASASPWSDAGRRQPRVFGPDDLAGQKACLARPAFLGSRQLALGGGSLSSVMSGDHSWRCIADSCLVSRIVA